MVESALLSGKAAISEKLPMWESVVIRNLRRVKNTPWRCCAVSRSRHEITLGQSQWSFLLQTCRRGCFAMNLSLRGLLSYHVPMYFGYLTEQLVYQIRKSALKNMCEQWARWRDNGRWIARLSRKASPTPGLDIRGRSIKPTKKTAEESFNEVRRDWCIVNNIKEQKIDDGGCGC